MAPNNFRSHAAVVMGLLVLCAYGCAQPAADPGHIDPMDRGFDHSDDTLTAPMKHVWDGSRPTCWAWHVLPDGSTFHHGVDYDVCASRFGPWRPKPASGYIGDKE